MLYDSELDLQREKDLLDASMSLIYTGEDFIGWMTEKDWNSMYNTLVELTIIEDRINPRDLYTMQFLNNIYK